MKVPFAFPEKARVGRMVPKNRIYAHAASTTALKDLFVRQVDRITWAYKLSPETINLPPGKAVKEFQVFTVALKTGKLKEEILAAIDRAIPSPILFEVVYGPRLRYWAAYKRPSEADGSKWVISRYFSSEWLPREGETSPLPVALDLDALYHSLLKGLLPFSLRPEESMDDFVQRTDRIGVLEREAEKVALRLKREKQFNRKVEINRELKKLTREIQALKQ
jgi:hypothetical protein